MPAIALFLDSGICFPCKIGLSVGLRTLEQYTLPLLLEMLSVTIKTK